jgi:hypothetical protein
MTENDGKIRDNSDILKTQTRGFWASLPRRLFLISLISAVVGDSLVLLYPTTNGIEVAFGFYVGIGGMILLLYSVFLAVWRSRAHYSTKREKDYNIYKKSAIPALFGGISYLIVTMIQPEIIPLPEVLKSSVVTLNAPNVIGIFIFGGFVSLCVISYSIRYSNKISPSNIVLRSVIYAFFPLFIVTALITLYHLDGGLSYLLLEVALNAPRYLVLGLVVGLVYRRSYKDPLESSTIIE